MDLAIIVAIATGIVLGVFGLMMISLMAVAALRLISVARKGGVSGVHDVRPHGLQDPQNDP